MTHNKRKKNSRQRGSHTHGGGAMKKRRGAGHRGGRGNAGSGKRGDVKKPSFWKNTKHFGKFGFRPINKQKINAINLNELQAKLETLLKQGKVTKQKDVYKVDLMLLGYDKLLGTGKVTSNLEINVDVATQKAISKVESAGGKVILPEVQK